MHPVSLCTQYHTAPSITLHPVSHCTQYHTAPSIYSDIIATDIIATDIIATDIIATDIIATVPLHNILHPNYPPTSGAHMNN